MQQVGARRFRVVRRSRSKAARCNDEAIEQVGDTLAEDSTRVTMIDAPEGERAAFDAAMVRLARDGQQLAYEAEQDFAHARCGASVNIEQIVVAASRELIAVRLDVDRYAGGSHGAWSTRKVNWSVRLGRALTPADIFSDPHDRKLVGLLNRNFDGAGDGCPERPLDIDLARGVVVAEGIRFDYDAYELGPYTCHGQSRLTWHELKPFLRASLPFDPATVTNATGLRWSALP